MVGVTAMRMNAIEKVPISRSCFARVPNSAGATHRGDDGPIQRKRRSWHRLRRRRGSPQRSPRHTVRADAYEESFVHPLVIKELAIALPVPYFVGESHPSSKLIATAQVEESGLRGTPRLCVRTAKTICREGKTTQWGKRRRGRPRYSASVRRAVGLEAP